jgi:predicted solute-binding protein
VLLIGTNSVFLKKEAEATEKEMDMAMSKTSEESELLLKVILAVIELL